MCDGLHFDHKGFGQFKRVLGREKTLDFALGFIDSL